jgi:molybdopterin converting factor subunit 1
VPSETPQPDQPCAAGCRISYTLTMTVTVLLFASVAEALGTRRLEIEVGPGDRVADVRDRVAEAYPAIERFLPNLLYALNEDYAELSDEVPGGATLAFIPPVSGGC